MEIGRHLKEPELQLGSVARRDHVHAGLRVVELWQVRVVPDDRSTPTHLEAVRCSLLVQEPRAERIAPASSGREVLRDESEAAGWTDVEAKTAAVRRSSVDSREARVAGWSPGGEVTCLKSAVHHQIAGNAIAVGCRIEGKIDDKVLADGYRLRAGQEARRGCLNVVSSFRNDGEPVHPVDVGGRGR